MSGVISRRAAVEGSYPGTIEACEGDTVAYCGRVPVKVIGSARAGDIVMPSGNCDGTGIVSRSCTAFSRAINIGTVETDLHESGSMCLEDCSSDEIELDPIGQENRAQSWQYVTCSVVSPSLTRGTYGPVNVVCWILCFVLIAGSCDVLAGIISGQAQLELACKTVVLEHGNVSGSCDGYAGSTCSYTACNVGYALISSDQTVQDATPSVEATRPPGGCFHLDSLYPFPPCTTCFGDGLMCEPRNRTYPLPAPHPFETNHDPFDRATWPDYPYKCPNSFEDLQSCEPEGRLCFGPYNGYPPCAYCNEVQDGSGIACEASTRYVRWGLRDDDDEHFVCLSSADPNRNLWEDWTAAQGAQYCECPSQAASLFTPPYANGCLMDSDPKGILRTAKFCMPTGEPTRARDPKGLQVHEALTISCSSPRPLTKRLATISRTRHCGSETLTAGQPGEYDGTEMHCARLYCPAETLGMLRLGACRLCEGREAFVSIPR